MIVFETDWMDYDPENFTISCKREEIVRRYGYGNLGGIVRLKSRKTGEIKDFQYEKGYGEINKNNFYERWFHKNICFKVIGKAE